MKKDKVAQEDADASAETPAQEPPEYLPENYEQGTHAHEPAELQLPEVLRVEVPDAHAPGGVRTLSPEEAAAEDELRRKAQASAAGPDATARPLLRSDPDYYDFTHEEAEFGAIFYCVRIADETQELAEQFPEDAAAELDMKPEELQVSNIKFPNVKAYRRYKRLQSTLFIKAIVESVRYCRRLTARIELSQEDLAGLPEEVQSRLFATVYAKSALNLDDEAWLRLRDRFANGGP